MIKTLLILLAITAATAIEVPLKLGGTSCLALMSSFDPVHVEIKFPEVASHVDGEQFRMKLFEVVGEAEMLEVFVGPGTVYRKSFELVPNLIYELCITYDSDRTFTDQQVIYLAYTAEQDFQSRIGQVQIPPELVKEQNLKRIFEIAKKLESVSKIVSSHQAKQRQLQDEIVSKNIHKSQRILTLGLIESLVIVLSGVYQLFALRKFLMEKNLY